MSRFIVAAFVLVLALFVLPVAAPAAEVTPSQAPEAAPAATDADEPTVTVSIGGAPAVLPLETYVAGVVTAEIGADFPTEAIRAQAVAARTYALCKLSRGRSDVHPDADLCDDYHHCAAYTDAAEAALADGQTDRILQAVQDTAGQYLTYEDQPIVAVFHCASAARTESALDVWGEDIPYLQSVVSPGGSACSAYADDVTVSADEFRQTAGDAFPSADLSGAPEDWFKGSVRSAAGGIKTVQLGGVTVEGAAVRSLFALHSANFTVTCTPDSITFHTLGYGHGVGLSQYGAKWLAEQGETYAQILAHYYPHTTLTAG